MSIFVCTVKLAMESVTRKGREALLSLRNSMALFMEV